MEYISQTQTLVGQRKRELVDTQTGEIIWVDQITKRTYGTKNFWKCYLMDFLTVFTKKYPKIPDAARQQSQE